MAMVPRQSRVADAIYCKSHWRRFSPAVCISSLLGRYLDCKKKYKAENRHLLRHATASWKPRPVVRGLPGQPHGALAPTT